MHINQANLFNLKALWEKYGSVQVSNDSNSKSPLILTNTLWPRRVWLTESMPTDDLSWLSQIPKTAVFPVLPSFDAKGYQAPENTAKVEHHMENNQWNCILEQTAMYLPLSSIESTTNASNNKLCIKEISSTEQVAEWIDIISQAFQYTIDHPVIEQLSHDNDVKLFTGYYDNKPASTALLYKTDDVIGIHQVGVSPQFQGKGIAHQMMEALLTECKNWQGQYAVLQASEAGKRLYDRLGFYPQFVIKSYRYS